VTCVQTFMYFQNFSRDALWLRSTVLFLWMCDTVHLALITHGLYFYAVTNFSNPKALQDPTLSIMVHIIITSISDLTVRYVFGHRLWILTSNIPLAVSIAVTSLLVFCSSMSFTSLGIHYKSFSNFTKIQYLLYMAFGSGVVADTIIAAALCIVLTTRRTGFRQTDSLVNVLMVYTINTGVMTSVVAILCLVLFAIMPHNYIFLALFFNLSKLYLNALLATLNARTSLRDQMDVVSSIQLAGIAESRSDNSSKKVPTSPHIAISVERYTETKPESLNESSGAYEI